MRIVKLDLLSMKICQRSSATL